MLVVEHVKNTYEQALKKYEENNQVSSLYIGYLEACLVQFDEIESKANGVADYMQKVPCLKFFRRNETRAEIIMRLTESFLRKHNLLK